MNHVKNGIVAIVVTYNPKIHRLASNLKSLNNQVALIVVVDNGSTNIKKIRRFRSKRTKVVELGMNFGIAKALNVGIDIALRFKPRWLLTMDQDTILYVGAIKQILRSASTLPRQVKSKIAILALSYYKPRILDKIYILGEIAGFYRARFVITSGNLINTRAIRDTGMRFREDLFMDQVDFEFCLRLNKIGYNILQYKKILMKHEIGTRVNGIKEYENRTRMYYIIRNSLYLVIHQGFPLSLYFFQIFGYYKKAIRVNGIRDVPFLITLYFAASLDALNGRMGKCTRC